MARRIIDIGAIGNDGTGDSIRDSFRKVNENFRELYSSLGLGDNLTFIGLDDTPKEYDGQENSLLGVNNEASGVEFKTLVGGLGIQIDAGSNPREIRISSEFTSIVNDIDPRLGGDLKARSGTEQYRVIDLPPYNFTETNPLQIGGPVFPNEAVSKSYADSKISRAGIDAIDPADPSLGPIREFGQMTGPLILSRNPEPDDDEKFGGLIAATKQYVDTGGFSSTVNLYVATSGQDERPGVAKDVQGRSLASAFRTIEAALKRAEELVLESPVDIGPYKKILTYLGGTRNATLAGIVTSPDSGSGFAGFPEMRVDGITINLPGNNYLINDIVEIVGGDGSSARIQVLDTITTPGGIRRFRIISSGLYTTLPEAGPNGVSSQLINDTSAGSGATFNVTYRVNNIVITDKGGSLSPTSPPPPENPGDPLPYVDYGLVSVRIVGGGGTGAFGTADVVNGQINSITVNDQGKGFTSIPSVVVDLPRFLLKTEGFRTDATGDVTTDTPVAFRTRDLREGLFIKGESSGALAIILAHEGALDSDGNEIFDMDIVRGSFEDNEVLSYGDFTKVIQISVKIESGIYEENYPLKIPQNVAIIGDEFRRVLVKPRTGISSSPWAFQKFRRDTVIDGLVTASQLYGHHYLTDSSQPIYPKINNKGDYRSAADLIDINRFFLQEEVIATIEYLINQNLPPFSVSFNYDRALCKRDVGLLVDSIIFDLRYGGYNRTISAALKYFQNASGLIAIGSGPNGQLSQTVAANNRLRNLIKDVINNTLVDPSFNETTRQVIDQAFAAEFGSESVVDDLFDAFIDIISGTGNLNFPKNNNDLDVFLCNDANIIRAVTGQGHGGFMMVLDPEGQILAKSPYCQESASFSRSINSQIFAGGMFVDGFTGNLQFKHTGSISPFRIEVTGLDRRPETPCSFIVQDTVFRVNFIRDFVYDPNGSSCNFNLDETTPFFLSPGEQEFTITPGDPATFTRISHGLENGAILTFTSSGSLPSEIESGKEYYVIADGLTTNNFRVTDNPAGVTGIEITSTGSGTLSYIRIYELLMPGNRSMLSNDYTQVCDLGYGLIATNGGLTEAVSMFTYYCHISYYSLNGGQIRSISGSSAHGNFALVAEGADPLEIPTPVTTYTELGQKLICVSTPGLENAQGDLFVNVTGFEYIPFEDSELEVDHNGIIFRYPIISVGTDELPPGIARLNLASDGSEGLFDAIPDGTVLTWRANSKIVLTGDIVEVAVRPSTGLRLNETPNTVYRVIQFSSYEDPSGPYPVSFSLSSPTDIEVLTTIITIGFDRDGITPAANVCTTDNVHKLQRGDKFIPKTTSNGLTAGVTYFIVSVPNANQFVLSLSENGPVETLNDGTDLSISGAKSHRLLDDYLLEFRSDNVLPTGIFQGQRYFVLEDGLTDTTFRVSDTKNGNPVGVTDLGAGNHTYAPKGLALTQLRENYDYIDITVFQPGEFVTDGTVCTIATGAPAVITAVNHGLNVNDVIKFTTTGNLPTGLSPLRNYFVHSTPTPDTFTVKTSRGGGPIEAIIAGSGTQRFGLVTGRAGDSQFAVVGVSPQEATRIPGSKFIFKGEQYIILDYNTLTGQAFARVTLDRPLADSIINLDGVYTIKSAVPSRTAGAAGSLTIRISLTRVTSHDLLEIGTGSYADTNYPQEIYGPPVNPPDESKETVERDVGRVFYVTTDQFGNFRVGPFFAVDQGTGRVTFSAAIALSNLDGIGFKRGVPISEFSIDSSFSDNAIDTVPTENATRTYIERRLGATHGGDAVAVGQLIPPIVGGFMALSGSLAMKANMNLGNNKIVSLGNPTEAQDAVNLGSLTFDNFQETTVNNLKPSNILAFTGVGKNAINAEVIGDIALTINSSNNTINAQINPGSISNADVNANAAIAQSKLAMNAATTRADATGITQADRGIASFSSAEFTSTNGWIRLRENGVSPSRLERLPARSVLANNLLDVGNVTPVGYATIVDFGNALKKSQFGQNPVGGVTNGFVRRNASGVEDSSFQTVDMSVGFTGYTSTDNSRLIQRDSSGNFGGNRININEVQLRGTRALDFTLTATGGFFRLRGFEGRGGVLVQDGTLPTDRKTAYWNNQHDFKDIDGVDFAPIRCSEIETTALKHPNGNTGGGTITGRWTLTGTSPNESRLQATYSADLAEYYEGDEEYEVGTVLVFGGDKEVTISTQKDDTAVAGVVSNTAAFAMFEGCPGLKNLVALQGRVPCRVIGKIKKGDLLITSDLPGVATVASENCRVGTIVGKAIEDYNSDTIGVIEIAVGRT
jgi:hypothetical protein